MGLKLRCEGTEMWCGSDVNEIAEDYNPWADVRNPPPPTPPPPLENFGGPIFPKSLYPQAVQISLSALISRVRLPWRANWKVGISLILGVGVTFSKWGWYWTLAIIWDTPNLLWLVKRSNRYNYQHTFQKHTVLLSIGKKSKTSQKCHFFCSVFENFHKL